MNLQSLPSYYLTLALPYQLVARTVNASHLLLQVVQQLTRLLGIRNLVQNVPEKKTSISLTQNWFLIFIPYH